MNDRKQKLELLRTKLADLRSIAVSRGDRGLAFKADQLIYDVQKLIDGEHGPAKAPAPVVVPMPAPLPEPVAFRTAQRKLTMEQARAIRAEHTGGKSIHKISKERGLNYGLVDGIVKGRTYKEVQPA